MNYYIEDYMHFCRNKNLMNNNDKYNWNVNEDIRINRRKRKKKNE